MTKEKIVYIGSHCIGKSTEVLTKAAELKVKYPFKSVKAIEENIREIMGKYKPNTTEFAKLCFTDCLYKEAYYSSLYDVLVVDRAPFDCLVYLQVHEDKSLEELLPEYAQLGVEHFKSYSEIYFMRPIDYSRELLDDGFRDTNLVYRNNIDRMYEKILKHYNIKYTEIRR